MDRPPPLFLASYAAAAIAGMGAMALQAAWPAALAGSSTMRSWQLPAVLVAATAFLLVTMIFHMRHTRRMTGVSKKPYRDFAGLACDLAVGMAAGGTLAAGHRTAVVGQGLWSVPPILLAACAASALAGVFAWGKNGLPTWRNRSELLRMVLAVLVVALLALQ
jgi:hypothetical protein